ncbi:hypothetical protein D2T29_11275 [Sinirhodobacter populi]|uniref:Uncharacterized protein n=1 Tax=Paenirhodobacter populi TaxID=2306993 RepID=A0A443KEG4_9RHOB|nr:hypothetical protein D2T29_11275 [Sinirhodobacter populi]
MPSGREFCGTERHPYELSLDLSVIDRRRTKVKRRRASHSAQTRSAGHQWSTTDRHHGLPLRWLAACRP